MAPAKPNENATAMPITITIRFRIKRICRTVGAINVAKARSRMKREV